MITVLFRKLVPEAVAPERKHEGDAGWDVTACSVDFHPGIVTYGTGLSFAIPQGYWLMAVPRSSIFKKGLLMANAPGVIDSGYRGEVKAMFHTLGSGGYYDVGDRVFQLILMPAKADEVEFKEVDELPESWDGRGNVGFGSTGR